MPTDESLDPENKKIYAFSYVITFTYHPELNIDTIIIDRSFGHSTNKLTSLNNLTSEQLIFENHKTHLQLRDCAINVVAKNNPLAISEMFSTELKFASDCLLC